MTNRYWKSTNLKEIREGKHPAYCNINDKLCIKSLGYCSECPIESGGE